MSGFTRILKHIIPIIGVGSSLAYYNIYNDSFTSNNKHTLPKLGPVFGNLNDKINDKITDNDASKSYYLPGIIRQEITNDNGITSQLLKIDGHLFDTNLINQILDLIEKSGGKFDIKTLRSGVNTPDIQIPSSLILRVDIDDKKYHELMDKMDTLISIIPNADATLTKIPFDKNIEELFTPEQSKALEISKFIELITTDDILSTANASNVLDYRYEITNKPLTPLGLILKIYYITLLYNI